MKKPRLSGTAAGKKKDKNLSKFVAKQRYGFYPSSQNFGLKNRSLKKYRTNVIRVPAGDPVHFYSLELSRLV